MFRKSFLALRATSICSIVLGTALHAGAQAPWPSEVQKHLDAATKIANGDKFLIDNFRVTSCFEVEDPAWRQWARAQAATRVPLTQLFDNVWYIGDRFVGQYIYKTADGGFMLIDTLNNSAEVEQYTLPAFKTLGINQQNFRGVVLTHGHFDHDGGAIRLRSEFGSSFPIYLGSGDAAGKTYLPTAIDSTNAEPQKLTIGGTEFTVQSTAGHTPGSIVGLVPVTKEGKKYSLLLNWRAGIPATAAGSKLYLTGTERAFRLALDSGAEGVIHTHPISDVTLAALDNPSLFIIGNEKTVKAAAISRECSAARAAQLDATAQFSTWRSTSLAMQTPTGGTSFSARLQNEAGPMAGYPIRFRVEGKDGVCSASTDSSGIATCDLPAVESRSIVTAKFEGREIGTTYEMPSRASGEAPEFSSGGCTIGNGRFDPLLVGMAFFAGLGVFLRRRGKRV